MSIGYRTPGPDAVNEDDYGRRPTRRGPGTGWKKEQPVHEWPYKDEYGVPARRFSDCFVTKDGEFVDLVFDKDGNEIR